MMDIELRERARCWIQEHGLNAEFLVSIVSEFAEKEVEWAKCKQTGGQASISRMSRAR